MGPSSMCFYTDGEVERRILDKGIRSDLRDGGLLLCERKKEDKGVIADQFINSMAGS